MRQYNFSFSKYKREFKQPLKTSHGIWQFREGIIIKLIDNLGNIAWGEIAPLPWFGSETLTSAFTFCQQLGNYITDDVIQNIPHTLPACQFAFSAALENFFTSKNPVIKYSYLLPTGENALKIDFKQGYDTFKWKIGVNSFAQEVKLLEKLIQKLPTNAQLRLDANGGLSLSQTEELLKITDNLKIIEFIEQPLPSDRFEDMLKLQEKYQTTLALDESVANLNQLKYCYQQGWQGVFVIKAAIVGSIVNLREFLLKNNLDVVFSSVLETPIGAKTSLNLASQFSQRVVGFGVDHWFKDNEINWL